jgi:hypothetical protein
MPRNPGRGSRSSDTVTEVPKVSAPPRFIPDLECCCKIDMKWRTKRASCSNAPPAGIASFEQIFSGEGLCAMCGDILLANLESRPGMNLVEGGQGGLVRVGRWLGLVEVETLS